MRGSVALILTLAVAAFSGCVELVGEDPDVEAAAAEAEQALADYQNKAGHVSGTVTGADGLPLVGAVVELLTVAQVKTDDAGRFSFLDLTPGNYSLSVEAADHLGQRQDVKVLAGQFTRPAVQLEAVPAPEPYTTLHRLDGYTQFSTIGLHVFSCYCYLDGELQPDGLVEVVLEAAVDEHSMPFGGSYGFQWAFDAYTEDDSSYSYGYADAPMRVSIPAEEVLEGAESFYANFEPAADLVSLGQSFTAYVTVFYHEGAAEDYTAFALE